MSVFEGLTALELITLSGMCAISSLTVASIIGGTVAWWVCRERAPAPASQPAAAKPAATEARAPEYAATA